MARSAFPSDLAGPVGRFPGIPRRALMAVAIAVAIVTGALLLTSVRLVRGGQVARLPEDQRHALYQRMHADLELCATASGALIKKHCEHQAQLIVELPECNAGCRQLAAPWTMFPTR
jgi:hypothetical protein